MLLTRLALLAVLLPTVALAQRDTSREALARVEETLTLRLEQGGIALKDVTPAIVVSVSPAFEESRAWYPTAALQTLVRVFGSAALRSCEACMASRLFVEEGRLEQFTTTLGTEEIIRLDENARGKAPPARVAIWLDETLEGVSLRIINLHNSRIVFVQNFDPGLTELARTRRNFTLTEELERRARGDSLTHTFLDVTMYPGQHISLDFAEQWGDTNANLAGLSLSAYDPLIGVGGAYYRVIPNALNIMVGAKVLLSVPTAIASGIGGQTTEIIDPLLTAVFVVRLPIASSNYGVTFTASTNGRIGFGISLMNITALPFLP
ncbi:hypothetical protein JRI60_18265 [Archangium violaceum]|uniref:hypothetical protein n=1 Tax=Archangium violaceum TaxID=83451 RepID=UPI00194FC9A5|nr:hypothetical protein [Archangium violaceum]QRO00834.1 hypothetical protein JRI60_18265 [Archangium violaceum]